MCPSKNSQRVYSTETGDLRKLKLPEGLSLSQEQPTPAQTKVQVVLDRKARRGKTVTLVKGVPHAQADELCKKLRVLCGAGGTVDGEQILIQGEHCDKITQYLRGAGYRL
ncbi:translation initiation factor [Candidatus Sumerlaeota bacterium]|nr:translation initiation factor [Candidatus Sumerlaeota bacterium]